MEHVVMSSKTRKLLAIAVTLAGSAGLGASTTARACSSCGSGGGAPLFLQPNENVKSYLGLSQRTRFRDILSTGELKRSHGRQRQFTYLGSVGLRLNRASFLSVSVPYMVNHRTGHRAGGFADPSLDGRYTLVRQTFAQPALPQIQILGGYTRSVARSATTSRNPYFLDALGSGHDQARLGTDIWFGMWPVVFGGSYVLGYSLPKDVEDKTVNPGASHTFTGTIGTRHETYGKAIAGVVRRTTAARRIDGEAVSDSQTRTHNPFFSYEVKLDPVNSWRLTLIREGAFSSKNAVRANTVTLAYMRSHR